MERVHRASHQLGIGLQSNGTAHVATGRGIGSATGPSGIGPVGRVIDGGAQAGGRDDFRTESRVYSARGTCQTRRRHELTIHEVGPIRNPRLHQIDLRLITAPSRKNSPSILLARLRGSHLTGQIVDPMPEVGGGKMTGPQFLVAVDVVLKKLWVAEDPVPPGIIEEVGAEIAALGTPHPRVGVPTIGGAERPIEIPDWAEMDLPFAFLVEKGAQSQGIDVERQHVQEVMIHPGTGIDVRSKSGHGVGEPVVVIQGIPEGREVVADIIQLGGAGGELELVFPRINQGHRLVGCENPRISRVQTVDLHEVTAGQRGQREVLRLQSPGIDPVLAHLDPVHQHINARVTGRVDRPGA